MLAPVVSRLFSVSVGLTLGIVGIDRHQLRQLAGQAHLAGRSLKLISCGDGVLGVEGVPAGVCGFAPAERAGWSVAAGDIRVGADGPS